jgi:hypothetical protein
MDFFSLQPQILGEISSNLAFAAKMDFIDLGQICP